MFKGFLTAAFATGLLLSGAVQGAQDDRLQIEYDLILSDVSKMGTMKIEVYVDAEAGLLMAKGEFHLDFFGRRVDITWTEGWRDDRLVVYQGIADIDRKERKGRFEISLKENGDVSLLTVNGTSREVPADIAPGTWWRKSNVVGRTAFFDIDDGNVREEPKAVLEGERKLKFKGKNRTTEFWKISGDGKREFWFLSNDVLVKYQRPSVGYWRTQELVRLE